MVWRRRSNQDLRSHEWLVNVRKMSMYICVCAQVLDEIGIDISAAAASAPKKAVPAKAQAASSKTQEAEIEEDMEGLSQRLANLR